MASVLKEQSVSPKNGEDPYVAFAEALIMAGKVREADINRARRLAAAQAPAQACSASATVPTAESST